MDVLKKIKASTLMETLVSTVLIIVIFMITSMILNNVFSSTIKNNTRDVSSHLNKLEYMLLNEVISAPYKDDCGNWSITVENDVQTNVTVFNIVAHNSLTNQTIETVCKK